MRARRAAIVAAAALLFLDGCALHKRRPQPFQMPPFTPVELAEAPPPTEQPLLEADEDEDDLPPVPVAEGATVPPRQRRKPAKAVVAPPPETPPPAQAAVGPAQGPTESESAASVIGAFTPGGTLDPSLQHDAADLIAANEKRLNALPAETVRSQASLVSNVRNFQRQAQEALKTGDAAGAKTLATKGKLLLDDLDRTGT